ncbi:MAG: 3-ketoacyl-ACP reductase [Anaerolineae bacterium]|nr:3-ketoacyl-ACP reductase [Anaerolineae bacterium]
MADRKVALVTGGTRGIGLGIARALAREGCDLALCGRREERQVAAALRELEGLGARVLYRQADVGCRQDRERLVGAVKEGFGRLNVLVNNAGMAPRMRADILEATEESFEEVMRTNLQGPYFLTQAVARWLIEQKRDGGGLYCIINISSISATVASPSRGEYCLSKAALSMATALWAVRLAEFGIPVYEVRPGIVESDMTAPVHEKYDRLIADGLLLQGRWGQPEDVGRAVAMLVRGELPYSTGQVILVDGGFTVPRL